jgi:hypothetical protein
MKIRLFFSKSDGGKDSGVTGYWLIEWKKVFSVVLLKFEPNHRENYHSHAFNAITWWIKGEAEELLADGTSLKWKPSIWPKWTPKSTTHKYQPLTKVYAISLRGPWENKWNEVKPDGTSITLTHGRVIQKT